MKMSVIEGYGNSQLFGDHINEYDACCVFHITKNKKWQYSLYCANPNTDLSTIAELYGGGGHKNASGFHLDKKLF
jgi:nanoRNase/pAp phosphatase (c-di-AMP/oligoRNAs hydrolase)